ncbi:MAG: LysR family transcriptional regulator [Clostridiales Family XIII bacterium]|jgi:DNA-binding transcriptional LysR family regulator|nr:LysR family transcriptional regulator [Clostridiales Family XIII bacterium]
MVNDITLQQIEIFLTVAEQLNLSEAAKDLFLNQSVVSRWISRLETRLGVRLFHRNNRGVELTENGEFLYETLKPLYEKLSNTLRDMRSVYDVTGDILHIGCLDSSEVIGVLRTLIPRFEKINPDIIIKPTMFNFNELRDTLICGDLDCIVSYSFGFGEYWNISTKKVRKLDTFLAVSANGKLARYNALPPPEALERETLYLLSLAEMTGAEIRAIKICEQLGFRPKGIKYMSSFFALEMAVKNGRGISICGSNLCERFRSHVKLHRIDKPYEEQYVILAWRENSGAASMRKFIDAIPESE